MFFGEYLVQKKIIAPDILVQAVLAQLSHLPEPAHIAYECNILNSDEMIQIFSYQQKHQLDFVTAGKNSGILDAAKEKLLEAELTKHRLPLASFLLKNGSTKVGDLVHALDDFLTHTPAPIKPEELPHFNWNTIDTTFGIELQMSLTPSKLAELKNVLQLVKQNANNKALIHEFLNDVLKNVHILRGLARAAKAQVMDHICTEMDSAIVQTLRADSIQVPLITEKLVPFLDEALMYCADLKDSIALNKSESAFWNEKKNQIRFQTMNEKWSSHQ